MLTKRAAHRWATVLRRLRRDEVRCLRLRAGGYAVQVWRWVPIEKGGEVMGFRQEVLESFRMAVGLRRAMPDPWVREEGS